MTGSAATSDDPGDELFRAAFHGALELMLLLDPDRRIVDANEATVAIHGGPREALVGQLIDDFLPTEVREALPGLWAQALEQGVIRGEAPAFAPDGSALIVEYQTRMNVLPGRHLVVGRDVTARQLLEDELRAVFDESVLPMVIADADYVLIEANRAALELLGRGRDTVIGRPVDDFVLPGVREKRADIEARPLGADAFGGDVRIERPDGTTRTVEFFARTNYVPGRHLAMLVDLTDRRDLEAQFLHAQKMEVVGRLAAGVAHDFNNLLAVILGCAAEVRGLLEAAGGSLVEIDQVLDAAVSATELTKQLLALGRKQQLEPTLVDLNELVSALTSLLRRVLGPAVVIRALLEPGLPLVSVDRGQLEQVLVNLAVNARDAMPDGGTLSIETSAEPDPGGESPGEVVLAVEDTGVGMHPDAQLRAFEPFFTTKSEGSGLGLSTVYGIVSQSNGRIFLTSREGEGTRIEIRLPAAGEASSAPAEAPEAETDSPRGPTVLLVDEDDQIRQMAHRALARRGYAVLGARDAAAALAALERAQAEIDLVVVSVELGSVALADAIRERRPSTPVLYTVAYGDDSELAELADPRKAAAGVLQKPYTPSMLAAAVGELLGRARPPRSGAPGPARGGLAG